jgi:hypothetical protein
MAKYIIKERYTEQVQGVRTYEVDADNIEEARITIPDAVIEDCVETRTIMATETFAIQLAQ